MKSIFATLAIISSISFASVGLRPIPRTATGNYVTEGLFEGGKDVKANLENLRYHDHKSDDYERWVFDFADPSGRKLNYTTPKFQLIYQEADTINLPNGKSFLKRPAKLRFLFRSIVKNSLSLDKLEALAKESSFVQTIRLYPPIEQGDMAVEFVLNSDIEFAPHQPIEKEGRLVIDLKASTTKNNEPLP